MAANLKICSIDPDLMACLKKFRFRKVKTNAAIIMKIDKASKTIVLEHELDDVSPDEVVEELPERNPRYVAYSYCHKHEDGRVSYPLCFIFISPEGVNPELMMMYSGSKLSLVNAGEFTKTFELRSAEEFTEEWLLEKLKFFR